MDVLNFIKKVKDFGLMAKMVFEKINLLLEDKDHNGRPDVVDALDKIVDLAKVAGAAHLAQLQAELAEGKKLLLEVKGLLEKLK